MAGNNNFFSNNVFTKPNVKSTPVGAPNVITLDYFAEGLTDYSLSCAELISYITYINVVGPTTGGGINLYLPSTNSLLGQTIVIKNTSADTLTIDTVGSTTFDEGDYATLTLDPPGSPGQLGSVTVMANPTNVDTWYVLNAFVQL